VFKSNFKFYTLHFTPLHRWRIQGGNEFAGLPRISQKITGYAKIAYERLQRSRVRRSGIRVWQRSLIMHVAQDGPLAVHTFLAKSSTLKLNFSPLQGL